MNIQLMRKTVVISCLLGLALITGCAATGPTYTAMETIPEGKALVYIYRPQKFMGGGVYFDVHAGNRHAHQEIVTLKNGGYFPYITDPGEMELWAKTESTSSVTLDLNAGDTSYVRGSVGVGAFIGRPKLTIVDNAVGAAEVRECKLLEPAPR